MSIVLGLGDELQRRDGILGILGGDPKNSASPANSGSDKVTTSSSTSSAAVAGVKGKSSAIETAADSIAVNSAGTSSPTHSSQFNSSTPPSSRSQVFPSTTRNSPTASPTKNNGDGLGNALGGLGSVVEGVGGAAENTASSVVGGVGSSPKGTLPDQTTLNTPSGTVSGNVSNAPPKATATNGGVYSLQS